MRVREGYVFAARPPDPLLEVDPPHKLIHGSPNMSAGRYGYRGVFFAIIATTAIAMMPSLVEAETWLHVGADGSQRLMQSGEPSAPAVTVLRHDETGLKVRIDLTGLTLVQEAMDVGDFIRVEFPACPTSGNVGGPAYPVIRRIFSAPDGASVDVRVNEGRASLIDLGTAGFEGSVYPKQPPSRQPLNADGTVNEAYVAPFVLDTSAYVGGGVYPSERASITELGLVRGRRLWLLEVRPVACTGDGGTLSVWPRINVELSFDGGTEAPAWLRPAAGMNRVVLNPEKSAARRDDPGNYLIVTAEDFAGSAPLTQFAAAKTAQGFSVTTYTAVSGSTRDTIKAYIQSLWGTADAPDYILIVGDALDNTNLVGPYSIPIWIGVGPEMARTDMYYGCMDGVGDWYPDIAIGRFPVELVSELQNLVDKTLYVENGVYADPTFTKRAVFVAGSDPDADAEARHDWIYDTHMKADGIEATRIYTVSNGSTTQDLSDAFNAGSFFVSYFAHAATVKRWATPSFDFNNIDALTNDGMYPFLMSFSCSSALFHPTYPDYSPCILEKFLRVPSKGAACGYGVTTTLDPYTWDHWGDVYRFVLEAIYRDGIRELGAATQAGMAHFVSYYGPGDTASRDMSEMFAYLGDPSLRLPEPPKKNYLIVVAPDFVDSDALDDFVIAKEDRGLNVTLYKPATGTSNTAIKSYITSLWGTPDAPDYVLLVGDATNGTFTVAHDTIPYWEGNGSKGSPTDWPYVCMDGGADWYPEIPIGRFSVRNETQLRAVVDKTIFVEAGNFSDPDYVRRGTFLANPSTYGQAEPTHDWVIDNYFTPNDYTATKLYAASGADTADVTAAVNAGSLFTLYFGHSSSSGWWDPSFDSGDVNGLSNTGLYGVAFGWSCNTAYFLETECFGEAWIRASGKGAAAYISASDYIYWGSVAAWTPSVVLEKSFFAAFFEDGIWEIGPAWQAGLYRFLAEHGGWDGDPTHAPTQNEDVCHNFFDEFVILGDPSLRLPQPNDFKLLATPEQREICSPPETEADFTIDVQRIGNFAGSVTLTATGLPAGATVAFDANDEYPPYSSIMTVSDLDLAAPDTYEIEIQGTSGSDVRTTTVQLGISDNDPAIPVLTTPSDGATGVAKEPVLSWQTAASATSYDLQLATDLGFTNVIYAKTVSATTHTVEITLDSFTVYFWRVRSANGCDDSEYSAPFNFTTIDQADYFTEEFSGSGGAFDLDNYSITLTPNGSGSYYGICGDPQGKFFTNPENGTDLSIGEDGSAVVTLTGGMRVMLYGVNYTQVYVNDNGNITFGSGDGTWTESLAEHFSRPRVSPLFDDFTVYNGAVRFQQTADRLAITYVDVPQYSGSDSNNFQVEFFFDGDIRITWLRVDSNDGIVGISAGNGTPLDFNESNLNGSASCHPTGACCTGESCLIVSEADCSAASGEYQGDNTSCTPNPCLTYDSSCLIISEVVQGKESGDCPRWMEITNTGTEDFAFFEGGVIVQVNGSSDLNIDVNLTGVVIPAGESIVINSNAGGTCTGAFDGIYPVSADVYTEATFGYGNERLILTDTVDSSHLIDIYGEFGVDGTGTPWEFTDGYSYRLPAWTSGFGGNCDTAEWYFGGVGSLSGPFPTQYLLNYTTPGTHAYAATGCLVSAPSPDVNCDGVVDVEDVEAFVQGLLGNQAGWRACLDAMYPGEDRCLGYRWGINGDLDGDGSADGKDIGLFISAVMGQ